MIDEASWSSVERQASIPLRANHLLSAFQIVRDTSVKYDNFIFNTLVRQRSLHFFTLTEIRHVAFGKASNQKCCYAGLVSLYGEKQWFFVFSRQEFHRLLLAWFKRLWASQDTWETRVNWGTAQHLLQKEQLQHKGPTGQDYIGANHKTFIYTMLIDLQSGE